MFAALVGKRRRAQPTISCRRRLRCRDRSTAPETTAENAESQSRTDAREKSFHRDSEGNLIRKRSPDTVPRSRLLAASRTWSVVVKNRAATPRFGYPVEESRSLRRGENSTKSTSSRPRNRHPI